jgi:transcriptional regulator with XRE-family HTH domain
MTDLATAPDRAPSPHDPATVGRVLRRARQRRHWSVREVARRLELGNTYLSQVERGVIRRPDPTVLWRLASLYSLDAERLLEWSGQAGPDRDVFFQALRALSALTPDDQAKALQIILALADEQRD